MVERYAHVAPEALQGAAARLDHIGLDVSGYDLATPKEEGVSKVFANPSSFLVGPE
jgi:hypothetical protein